MPKLSVIIPTYNRCESLKDTLDCFLRQEHWESFDYELLIIDNNSADQTKTVVEKYMSLFSGRLKYFFEPRQGRLFALNLGIHQSQGEIIAFTDDDCMIPKDFLVSIHRAFSLAAKDVGFIGGKILPYWIGEGLPNWLTEFLPGHRTGENPGWMYELFCGPLGILDYGEQTFIVDYSKDKKHFYGANISFRKKVFTDFGVFDENSLFAEDTEMSIRLLSRGVKAQYVPSISVFHKIKTVNVTLDFYYKWHYLKGKHRELSAESPSGALSRFFWFMKRSAKQFIKSFLSNSFKQKFFLKCMAWFDAGQMVKALQGNSLKMAPKQQCLAGSG